MSDVSPGPAEQGDRSFDARYRALVEQIPAVTYVIPPGSPDLPCLHVSPQIERLSGYTPEQWMADPHLWERTIHPDDLDRVLAESRRVDDTDQPWHIEYRLVHRSGEVVWVHDRASILPDGAGVRLWHGVLLDITAQKLAQEAQRESEERYRALVEQIPAVVYLVTVDGQPETIYVSPSIEDVTGFPPSAFQDDPTLWPSRVVGEGADAALDRWKEANATGARLEHEYQFVRADGTRIWFKDRSIGLRDATGATRYRQGIASDVSDRKIREQRLHESEAMYRALVENIPAVVYILAPDGDGSTLYVSPHVERLLGYTRQEWLDQPDIWMELLHPDDRERVLDAYDRANETGEGFAEEYRLIAHDGRLVWFRDDATLVRDEEGRPQLWQGVRLDITDQKLAEEGLRTARDELDLRVRDRTTSLEDANEMMMLEIAERKATEGRLRRAEAKYRGLVEQIPGAVAYIWEIDPTSTFADAYTSPAIEQLLGYTVQEWHDGDFYLRRVHPDDYDRILAATRRSEHTGEPYDLEVRYLHKDGRVVWVRERAALLERSDDGRPKLFNAVMIDVTERKQAEDRVRAAEDRQRALLEQIPGAVAYVWEAGSDGAASPVGYISPQVASVLGYTVAEWTARAGFWRERVHPDDRDAVIRGTGRCEETGEPFAMEYRYLAKDGRVVWVMDQALLVERGVDGGPWLFQGVFFDITERKQYERQILEAEERYRTLVEQIPAIVYVEAVDATDPTISRVVFVSPQVQEVLGYSSDELVSEPNHLQRLIHPDDWPGFAEEDRRSSRTGSPFSHEYRAIAKDGSIVWLQSRATLIRDDEGRPRFWHGIAIDITPRVQRERGSGAFGGSIPGGSDRKTVAPPTRD